MRADVYFHSAYRKLEARMRALAESDGDVFNPNPEPEGPVDFVLICMEPSLGRWARSANDARSRVEEGFRNFLPSDETSLLHFAVRHYLCSPTERYHITDLSKGAMLAKSSARARFARYDRWYPLLEEEIDLVATPEAGIIAVGKAVFEYLKRRGFGRPFTQVIHYSGQAELARKTGILGHEDDFRAFMDSVSKEDLVATAQEVLTSTGVPSRISNNTLQLLGRFSLNISRQQLLFNYKLAFERLRR